MFTGIVEELGEVVAIERGADSRRPARARPARGQADATHGASIAVNGVCLTVVEHGDGASPSTSWPRRCAARSLGDARARRTA